MRSEAHLPWHDRALPLAHRLHARRRSWRGWLILAGLVALNEARGLAVTIHILRAFGGH